jgi:hypothetical protein
VAQVLGIMGLRMVSPPYSRPQRIARRAGRFSRENLAIRTEERAA